jgi:hypothetical protein
METLHAAFRASSSDGDSLHAAFRASSSDGDSRCMRSRPSCQRTESRVDRGRAPGGGEPRSHRDRIHEDGDTRTIEVARPVSPNHECVAILMGIALPFDRVGIESHDHDSIATRARDSIALIARSERFHVGDRDDGATSVVRLARTTSCGSEHWRATPPPGGGAPTLHELIGVRTVLSVSGEVAVRSRDHTEIERLFPRPGTCLPRLHPYDIR